MTCDDRRDMIMLYAAGALEAGEAAEVRAHLATGCPACAGALAEAEAVLGMLPAGLDVVAPPAEARERLLGRVMGKRGEDFNVEIAKGRSRWRLPVAAGIAAAVVGSLITAGVMRSISAPKERLLGSPGVRFVGLAGAEGQPRAGGRIFWDREKNDWHVYVFDLAPPPAGKTYELWFITKEKAVPAVTFTVDASGRGSFVVKVPVGIGEISAAGVTRENVGGAQTPTMPLQLLGKV